MHKKFKKCDKEYDPCNEGSLVDQPGKFVFYSGVTTECLEIPFGLNLDDIILGLDSFLCELQAQIDAFDGISIEDTSTINLTGNGDNLALKADVVLSSDIDNILEIHSNGLYVPVQVNADWDSTSGPSEILNKPGFADVAFTGDYNDLINIPPVSVPNLQSVTDQGRTTTNPIELLGTSVLGLPGADRLTFKHFDVSIGGGGSQITSTNATQARSQITFTDSVLQIVSALGSVDISSASGPVNITGQTGVAISGASSSVSLTGGSSATVSGDTLSLASFSSTPGSLHLNSSAPIRLGHSTYFGPIDPDLTTNDRYLSIIHTNFSGGRSIGRFGSLAGGIVSSQRRTGTSAETLFSEIALDTTSSSELYLRLRSNIVGNPVSISRSSIDNSGTPNLNFRDNSGAITNTIFPDGRMSGTDAINNDEFVTLSQVSGLGSGTVTSVGFSAPSVFSVSGSPITTTGTLALSFAGSQPQNQVLATPNGSAGALGLRALVAADIPALDTSKITTGVFTIARGGTGLSALGTANQLLRVNSGATALEYFTPTYLTANQTITLSGDVAGSGTTSIATTIQNNTVTYAKMQDVTASRLIGRYTGSTGDPQEIQIGTGLTLNSGTGVLSNTAPDQTVTLTQGSNITITGTYPNFTIAASAPGTGTVTSVGVSSSDITVGGTNPITTSGTITLTLPNVNANIGTFNNLTVNAKGQVTAASNVSYLTTVPDFDEVLAAGNIANNSAQLGDIGVTAGYSFSVARNIGSADRQAFFTLAGNGTVGYGSRIASGTTRHFLLPDAGTTAYFSPDSGTNYYQMWHANNHAAGSTFTPTLTGANVPATFTTNASGHVTAFTTRALTPANIGADLDAVLTVGNSSSLGAVVSYVTTGTVNSGGPAALVLGTNNVDRINIASGGAVSISGNLGINQTAGTESLEVTGDGVFTGTVTATGGGFNSARALKEDIRTFYKSALSILDKISVVEFRYKNGPNNTIGFIADEAPSEVLVDGKEVMDVYSTIGLLIKGIQELNKKIDGLGSISK